MYLTTCALISLWVKPFQYSLEDISHGGDLVVVKQIDKVSTDGGGMRGGSVSNRPAPLVGEPDHRSVERSVAELTVTDFQNDRVDEDRRVDLIEWPHGPVVQLFDHLVGDPADRLLGHAQKYLCFSEKPAL